MESFVTTPNIRSLPSPHAFPWSWFIKSTGPRLLHPNPTETDSSSCEPPMLRPRVLCYFSEGLESFPQVQLTIERSNSARVARCRLPLCLFPIPDRSKIRCVPAKPHGTSFEWPWPYGQLGAHGRKAASLKISRICNKS